MSTTLAPPPEPWKPLDVPVGTYKGTVHPDGTVTVELPEGPRALWFEPATVTPMSFEVVDEREDEPPLPQPGLLSRTEWNCGRPVDLPSLESWALRIAANTAS